MSSQYNEDDIIHRYFGGKRDGRFLDLGAYDGKTFSNTFALAEKGWSGVCVEASPQCFVQLQKTYQQNPNIKLVNAAIADKRGCLLFYDNGGAIASLCEDHMEKWKEYDAFVPIHVASICVGDLLEVFPSPYDFVSIDIEGLSLDAFQWLPRLDSLGVKLCCVEAATPGETTQANALAEAHGLTFFDKTIENLFYKVKE